MGARKRGNTTPGYTCGGRSLTSTGNGVFRNFNSGNSSSFSFFCSFLLQGLKLTLHYYNVLKGGSLRSSLLLETGLILRFCSAGRGRLLYLAGMVICADCRCFKSFCGVKQLKWGQWVLGLQVPKYLAWVGL